MVIPKLLFDICHCGNFHKLITKQNNVHLCSKIVDFQRGQGASVQIDFQLPEPWSGDIVNAPILFISSNPAFSNTELYPLLTWPNPIIADFFINRFKDRGPDHSWVYKSRLLNKDGSRGKSVRYWSSIKKRTEELLGRIAVPGFDYCNTELVHCKSARQIGVKSALPECTHKFNSGTVGISGAKIIIGIGSFVKAFFNGVADINGIPIFYLPHPNAFEPKTFSNNFSEQDILRIRKILENRNKLPKKIVFSDLLMPTDDEVKQFIESQTDYHKKSINVSGLQN